jgi:hypothetical protein
MQDSRVADILLKARLLDDLQVRSARARQAEWGGRFAKHVVELGFADDAAIADALARGLGLPRVDPGALPRDPAALAKVDVKTAEEKGVFPFALRDNGKSLHLAMADPSDLEVIDFVAARSGCRIRPAVAGEREILVAIYQRYRNQAPPPSLVGADSRRPTASQLAAFSSVHPDPAAPFLGPAAPSSAAPRSDPALRPPPPAADPQSTRDQRPADDLTGLPPAVAAHLQRLSTDLERTTRVLRGLIELCVQKKIFTNEEMRIAVSRLTRGRS